MTTDQKVVDAAVIGARHEWKRLKDKYGALAAMQKESIELLAGYEMIRQEVLESGLEMPPLDESITVNLIDQQT